jgi:hypothetical protein
VDKRGRRDEDEGAEDDNGVDRGEPLDGDEGGGQGGSAASRRSRRGLDGGGVGGEKLRSRDRWQASQRMLSCDCLKQSLRKSARKVESMSRCLPNRFSLVVFLQSTAAQEEPTIAAGSKVCGRSREITQLTAEVEGGWMNSAFQWRVGTRGDTHTPSICVVMRELR